jgi:hypothetical protein
VLWALQDVQASGCNDQGLLAFKEAFMCDGREHRYNVKVNIDNSVEERVVFYSKGLSQAVAKADGWAAKNYPFAQFVEISCFRIGYGYDGDTFADVLTIAAEHGAIV